MITSSPRSSVRSGMCNDAQEEGLAPCPLWDVNLMFDFSYFIRTWFHSRISMNIYVAIV